MRVLPFASMAALALAARVRPTADAVPLPNVGRVDEHLAQFPTPARDEAARGVADLLGEWGNAWPSIFKGDCSHDILVTAQEVTTRIFASSYSGQPFPILSLSEGPGCVWQLAVTCETDSRAHLIQTSNCTSERQEYQSFQIFGSTRVFSEQPMALHPDLGLVDVALGSVRVRTSDSCDSVPAGACAPGCCGQGFTCNTLQRSPGVCVPWDYAPSDVCGTGQAACQSFVQKMRSAINHWVLLIWSSGGSGHKVAAENLRGSYVDEWKAVMDDAEVQLAAGEHLVPGHWAARMSTTLAAVRARGPAVHSIDLMMTPCYSALGSNMGEMSARIWNNIQMEGDTATMSDYVKIGQTWLNSMFSAPCTSWALDAMMGAAGFPFAGAPVRIVTTQPEHVAAMALAVNQFASLSPREALKFHIYLTDLPSVATKRWFYVMREVGEMWPGDMRGVRVHVVEPLEGGASMMAEAAGLPEDQIIVEPYMPISPKFIRGDLPAPGQAAHLVLKAQLPREERFLGGEEAVQNVASNDIVLLVMLGSQPTASAVEEYIQQLTRWTDVAQVGRRWAFVACGDHRTPLTRALYESSADIAEQFNSKQSELRIVPFTGQPAWHILGRADITVTRTGGITVGELLALDRRGDKKFTMLHMEASDGSLPPEPRDALRRAKWEEDLIEGGGMYYLEAGNTKYVLAKMRASLVTPSTVLRHIREEFK